MFPVNSALDVETSPTNAAQKAFVDSDSRNGSDIASDLYNEANGMGRSSTIRQVTVKNGDTLTKLAGTNDPDTLDRIAQYNGLRSRHEIRAGQNLQIPDEGILSSVDVSRAIAARGAAGADYYAQRQAEMVAAKAMVDAQPAGMCMAENPYNMPPITLTGALQAEPSALQRLGGAFEITAKGLWNLGAQSLAGLTGVASLPFGADTASDTIRNVQNYLSLSPSTEGGRYMANWLENTSLVKGLEGLKTDTGNYYFDRYGPVAGALGYSAPDAFLNLLPAAPKVFRSFGTAVDGAGAFGGNKATTLSYDISKWGEYGLPSDGVFSRTLTAEQYRAYKAGREFNFAGKPWPEGGYPSGMGFITAAEDSRSLTTVSTYREGLKLDYNPKYVLEFQLRDPAGLQNAIRAPYPEFVPGGKTGAGLREWNTPGISSNDITNSTVRVLK